MIIRKEHRESGPSGVVGVREGGGMIGCVRGGVEWKMREKW